MIRFAALTGLRQGELIALRDANVDLASRTLTVEATAYKGDLHRPKSAAGRRRVDLSRKALTVLREQLLARRPSPDGLVFPSPDGRMWRPDNFRHRVFTPAARRAGFEGVTFHDLRHTYAALMVEAGAHAKYLQAQMGHSTITTTLDTYGHLFPDANRGVLDALDELVGRRGGVVGPIATPSAPSVQPEVQEKVTCFQVFLDGAYRDRTGDLRLAKPALSQLS
jgi:integrase